MVRPPLTRRQKDILEFFEAFEKRRGISPTLEEIAQHLGVNKVTVFGHVAELERKGIMTKRARRSSRSLAIVPPAPPEGAELRSRAPSIRILGTVAAGAPIAAIEDAEEVALDGLLGGGKEVYALRVRGDSMIEDSIRDGDIVVLERRSDARDGETVVAVLEGEEATLKRYYDEGDHVRLQPANEALRPRRVPKSQVEVRGVLVAELRTY